MLSQITLDLRTSHIQGRRSLLDQQQQQRENGNNTSSENTAADTAADVAHRRALLPEVITTATARLKSLQVVSSAEQKEVSVFGPMGLLRYIHYFHRPWLCHLQKRCHLHISA